MAFKLYSFQGSAALELRFAAPSLIWHFLIVATTHYFVNYFQEKIFEQPEILRIIHLNLKFVGIRTKLNFEEFKSFPTT
ncbi:MAG: hypothetical protein C4323_25535 [Mastigocladus sp. ERB_26_2]